ncbi:MAG: ATP-binding protein, partial [Longimicrobiales bacterium]
MHPRRTHPRRPGTVAKLLLRLRLLFRRLMRLIRISRPPPAPSTAPAAPSTAGGAVVPDPAAPSAEKPPPTWHGAALPSAATPFIGRADELRELRDVLCDSPARLVTVTGPGGVGKTRLALQSAEQVGRTFRDGVAYAPLSGLASPDLLVPAIAESLGLHLSRREDPLGELKAFLREKQLLLVLDNFDHVTRAAGLLATLLDDAPGLQLLVTSRERLNLQHETLVALDGLALGDDDAGDAEKLFIAGARRLDRHFQLDAGNRTQVAQICAVVGGIPLAIELASAWIRTLSCAEILAELQRDLDVLATRSPDLEQRHHSLRATFDASWRLLSAEEQAVLARLAVFRSAFDRAAAGQVADASAALLRQLVDKSLLTRAGDRLLMLDVVRTYALDRLAADPAIERQARERHLACFTALLYSLQNSVQRSDPAAIQRIAVSIDDVRAAWNYATQTNNAAALLRAMDGLFHFYEAHGWAREGAEVFARSGAAIGDLSDQSNAARAIRLAAARLTVRHGVFLHRLGDLRSAESLLRRGVAGAREMEDRTEIVTALHRLGSVHFSMGDYAAAEHLHQEAMALAQQMNDGLAVGWSMTHLGNVAWARGEFDEATRLYTDALALLRAEHDLNGMWVTLNNLGVLAASRQQHEEAQRRFREGLALQSELKNPRLGAHVLHNLGCAARELGDFPRARQWLHEALEISDRMGYQSMAGLTLVGLGELSS